ncbi:hypothetical protein V6238_11855 [Marinomonas arenicola]|uniref:hypothetical protein n=1 Tax=Marinomonas arenicola TaxID=569601 RepID=UPI00311D9269
MSYPIKALMCCLVALLLSGCAADSERMLGKARTPVTVSEVQVLMQPPSVAYEAIAQIKVKVQEGFDQQARLKNTIAVLVAKAAKLGANGVIVADTKEFNAAYNRISTGTAFTEGASFTLSPSAFSRVKLSATAIYLAP